jgi:hypothetical protein
MPGETTGNLMLRKEYGKVGTPMIVWSEQRTCDILLKKQGSLASATRVDQASHVAPPSPVQSNPVHVSSEDVVSKQLADLGWATADIRTTIQLLKQRGQKLTLDNCRDYLEKMFRPAKDSAGPSPLLGKAPVVGGGGRGGCPAAASASSDGLSEQMLGMGFSKSQIDAAIKNKGYNMSECIDYISKTFRDVSPPRTNPGIDAVPVSSLPRQHEAVLNILLCVGSTIDTRHAFKHAYPTRQQFEAEVASHAGSDPDNQVYRCHARLGLQAALHLCHPSFASDDDLMVRAAQDCILDDVISPLQKQGWQLSQTFLALWEGHRDVQVPDSARHILESIALAEHLPACQSLSLLPPAFPITYAETLAIYMACKDASHNTKAETKEMLEVLEHISSHSTATFRRVLRHLEEPHAVGVDGLLRSQFDEVVSKATLLKTNPAYSPELKHSRTALGRRQNRCLCLCSAHLFNQSKMLYHDGKIASGAENPLQPDIDKLVSVARPRHPSIGRFLAELFERLPYRVPQSGEDAESNVFRNDLLALTASEHVRPQLPPMSIRMHADTRPGTRLPGKGFRRSSQVAVGRCLWHYSSDPGHAVGCVLQKRDVGCART